MQKHSNPVLSQGKDYLNSISGSGSFMDEAANVVEIATGAQGQQKPENAQKTNFCTHPK
jgi:hypothetical protein